MIFEKRSFLLDWLLGKHKEKMPSSNVHPPKANSLWKRRMKIFFKINFDMMLIMIYGFEIPKEIKRKESKDSRWIHGKFKSRISPIEHASYSWNQPSWNIWAFKVLWDMLVEIHEGTEAKSARRILLRSKLSNLKLKKGEKVASLNARIKELIHSLMSIGETISNRDA